MDPDPIRLEKYRNHTKSLDTTHNCYKKAGGDALRASDSEAGGGLQSAQKAALKDSLWSRQKGDSVP